MSSTAQSSNAAGNFYVQPWLKHLLLRFATASACWLELTIEAFDSSQFYGPAL
jgi:hypothetical protein